jgi:23S rRNA (uracil1939-C5)-methyltransferase
VTRAPDAETITVTCDDLDQEGAAVGARADQPGDATRVHVAGGQPGELLRATIEHRSPHRPQAWARLDEILRPSPERRAPACRAFGACGGCVLQHLDYAAQLRWKTARVRAVFESPGSAHAALRDVPVADCVASPRPLGYRNRSKLVCAPAPRARAGATAAAVAPGTLVLGAYAPRSHDVIDLVGGCRIAEGPLDDVAVALRDVLVRNGVVPFDERTRTGDLRHAVLRVNHRGQVLATLISARADWPAGAAVATELRAARPDVSGVVHNINPLPGNVIYGPDDVTLSGQPTLDDQIGDVRLRLSARAFLQANRDVAALAYARIAAAVALTGGETVVDAYAGAGAIALTLAARARVVHGIEENPAAVADAVASAALNGVAHAHFVAGDAVGGLAAIARADVVVLNPPRRGCDPAVLAQAARLAPRTIAYLSCDPTTLARDLGCLAERGYRTQSLTPFDMLPHTPHIEVLAVLEFQALG